MPYKDLREYLKVLESKGLLCHITAEVDKDWEISAVCRHTFRSIPQERRPALMFDKIKGHDIPLVVGILGGSREIYATALGTDQKGVWDTWARGKNPIAPKVVSSGPCQEVVHMGEDANLEMLPAPIWTVGQDPSPYHTSPFVISRDPETRVQNVGTYRLQVKNAHRGGLMINPQRGMRVHMQKNEAKGGATEAAIVFGTDPVIGLTSVSPFPAGVDELAAAGGIRGEAVEVVRCKTVDIDVPATAEIVVEGRVPYLGNEPEGPFGEYAGYMGAGGNNPVFEVTCITHRKNPIYQAFLSQMPPSESSCIKAFGRELEIRRHLVNNLGLPVQDVCLPESGSSTATVIVSLRKANRFQPLKVMTGVWSMNAGIGKIVIVVDDDINIRDPFQVDWAIAFRIQPDQDVRIISNTDPITLDPSQPLRNGQPIPAAEQVSSKLGIDATRKHAYPPPSVPPKEHLDKVAAQWERYGIRPVAQ
ncbi:MAG: UbiD family decarboxylase [Acidobacteria bacterium]|nr:UbiD family decarboxylase [Acidobacteriota bacterium]